MRLLPAVVLAAAVLAGCSSDRANEPGAPRPAAFQSEHFPDVPLWLMSSYQLDAEAGVPLAVAVAGGAVRRLDVSYASPAEADGEATLQVLDRFAGALPELGWVAGPRSGDRSGREQRWIRGDEALVVVAGKDGRRTTVRLLLGSAAAAAASNAQR
jgi:hypothetical protein